MKGEVLIVSPKRHIVYSNKKQFIRNYKKFYKKLKKGMTILLKVDNKRDIEKIIRYIERIIKEFKLNNEHMSEVQCIIETAEETLMFFNTSDVTRYDLYEILEILAITVKRIVNEKEADVDTTNNSNIIIMSKYLNN